MMNRLALVGYLAFALVAVSLVNRLAAQTQPIAGLTSVAISAGTTGPPSLFPSGTVTRPSISFAADPTTGFYLFSATNLLTVFNGANTMLTNNSGPVLVSTGFYRWSNADALGSADVGFGRNAAGVVEVNNGVTAGTRASLTLNNGGALIFGATTFATLNANAANGTLVFCSDCTLVSAFDQACVGGGTGALAVRQASSWRCFS